MVHNGIEYADMQLIAEAYDLLSRAGGLGPRELAEVFDEWNRGPLESFLIELTAGVFRKQDSKSGGALVDQVLDKAGQKGTGQWTARVALELGVPIPSITAALDARVLSSLKAERVIASRLLRGPSSTRAADVPRLVTRVRDALYASKVVAYAQGLGLIAHASQASHWDIDLGGLARIWKGGCIIRARLLDVIRHAYARDVQLRHLLFDPDISAAVDATQAAWRDVVGLAAQQGIPVPAMAGGLAYYDSLRTARLPQNLTQAQRDAFGAHTYQRADDPDGPFVHSDWLN
jgi:6-phosphogluconate dehydrogenase